MRRAAERLVSPAPLAPPATPADQPAPEPEADPYIHPGGSCRSWAPLLRVCGAEALGSALLVLLAPAPGPLAPLHAGLVVALVIQCLGDVSGAQVNPCVSLCAWLEGRMRTSRLAAELAAQLAGALLGAAAHAGLAPRAWDPLALLTRVAPDCPTYKALCVEAGCALCLALGNLAAWRHRRAGADTWPLRAAALVTALVAFAGPTTGGSMNPARSFGPALYAAHWDRHWVYWAGPLCGATAAWALHRLLSPRSPRAPRPARKSLSEP